jgi:hypothetical protein
MCRKASFWAEWNVSKSLPTVHTLRCRFAELEFSYVRNSRETQRDSIASTYPCRRNAVLSKGSTGSEQRSNLGWSRKTLD